MSQPGGDAVIVVPARYGSTRLPGKPLVLLAGRTLLSRVVDVARRAAAEAGDTTVLVATDDNRIADHCRSLSVAVRMTASAISTGSGRALAAMAGMNPSIIVNLQGDAPFATPGMIVDLIATLRRGHSAVATVVTRLSWPAVDLLRAHKATSPSSGTTCIVSAAGQALWFSKAVIPAVRDEARRRAAGETRSPIFRHIGVYGYTHAALQRFEASPPSFYEQLEGLEQLRFLEAGMAIAAVEVPTPPHALGGIDSPADLILAEASIARHGDPYGG